MTEPDALDAAIAAEEHRQGMRHGEDPGHCGECRRAATQPPWPHTADCECDPTAGEPTAALKRLIDADVQAMLEED